MRDKHAPTHALCPEQFLRDEQMNRAFGNATDASGCKLAIKQGCVHQCPAIRRLDSVSACSCAELKRFIYAADSMITNDWKLASIILRCVPSRAVPKLMSFTSCETANVQRVLFRPRQPRANRALPRQLGASSGAMLRGALLLIQSLAITGALWTAFISLGAPFHGRDAARPVITRSAPCR